MLLRAVWSDWTGAASPEVLVVPNFREGRPNDLAFAAPAADEPDVRQIHARFWRVEAAGSARSAYVGSVMREDPVGWLGDESGDQAIAPGDPAVRALTAALRGAGLAAAAIESE